MGILCSRIIDKGSVQISDIFYYKFVIHTHSHFKDAIDNFSELRSRLRPVNVKLWYLQLNLKFKIFKYTEKSQFV